MSRLFLNIFSGLSQSGKVDSVIDSLRRVYDRDNKNWGNCDRTGLPDGLISSITTVEDVFSIQYCPSQMSHFSIQIRRL